MTAIEVGRDGAVEAARFKVTRAGGDLSHSLTVNYSVDTAAANAATPGKEYTGLSGSVIIPAGSISAAIDVTPREINHVEGTTVVAVGLAPGNGYTASSAEASVNIINTDDGTISFPGQTFTVGLASGLAVTFKNHYGRYVPDVLTPSGFDGTILSPRGASATTSSDPSSPAKVTFTGQGVGGTILFFTDQAGNSANAQENVGSFSVKSLGFGGAGAQAVARDSGQGSYDQGGAWLDGNLNGMIDGTANAAGTIDANGEHEFPLSYVRSKPGAPDVVQVNLTVAGTVPVGTRIEGLTGYHSIEFGPVAVVAGDVHGGQTSVTFTASAPLPNVIDSSNLSITWETSSGGAFKVQAHTDNHLYVTGASAPNAFETVLKISCNAARGLQPSNPGELSPGGTVADQQVVKAVWGRFSSNAVQRADGATMSYNHDFGTGYSAADMLSNAAGRGQCTAWADLLVLALGVQGDSATTTRIDPIAGFTAFAVAPMPAQGSGGANYVPGTNATTGFGFHQVVRVALFPDSIFDPSYGVLTTKTDQRSVELKYEDQTITNLWSVQINDWVADSKGVAELMFTP